MIQNTEFPLLKTATDWPDWVKAARLKLKGNIKHSGIRNKVLSDMRKSIIHESLRTAVLMFKDPEEIVRVARETLGTYQALNETRQQLSKSKVLMLILEEEIQP